LQDRPKISRSSCHSSHRSAKRGSLPMGQEGPSALEPAPWFKTPFGPAAPASARHGISILAAGHSVRRETPASLSTASADVFACRSRSVRRNMMMLASLTGRGARARLPSHALPSMPSTARRPGNSPGTVPRPGPRAPVEIARSGRTHPQTDPASDGGHQSRRGRGTSRKNRAPWDTYSGGRIKTPTCWPAAK
jgi:hypothetical protein